MQHRNKMSPFYQKGQLRPLQLSTLQNQGARTNSKNKSLSNTLFKQQLLKNKQIVKQYNNQNRGVAEYESLNSSFEAQNRRCSLEEQKESKRLIPKFQINRNKFESSIDNENNKNNMNYTLKLEPRLTEHNNNLNSSFRSNDSRLKFLKKDLPKNSSPNLAKCLSNKILQSLSPKHRKQSPINHQVPSQSRLLKTRFDPNNENQITKLIEQLKKKDAIIKQLQMNQENILNKILERDRFQVEYYKVLNSSILLEEQLRAKERKIDDLETKIFEVKQQMSCIQNQKIKMQQLKGADSKSIKESQESILEWKKINQILSDSLIKLNQQNSLFSKKLSDAQTKVFSLNTKLLQSQKMISMLKNDAEFLKKSHQSLNQQKQEQISQFVSKIQDLERSNSMLKIQKQEMKKRISNLQQQIVLSKDATKKIIDSHEQKTKNTLFFEQQSILLIDQVKASNQKVHYLQKDNHFKNIQIVNLKEELETLVKQSKNTRTKTQFSYQEEQLRERILILKISQQEKELRYEHTIRQCRDKISILQKQIEEMKTITSQTEICLQQQDNKTQYSGKNAQVLQCRTQIVELKSKLEVLSIIQKELRKRLEMSQQRIQKLQQENQRQVNGKDVMIETLKQRIQLLEQQLKIVNSLNQNNNSSNEDALHSYIKQLLTKINNMEEIVSNIHTENKSLQQQIQNKCEFAEQLEKQIDKDDQTIRQLRKIISEISKRFSKTSELVQKINEKCISDQLSFGDQKEELLQRFRFVEMQNVELKKMIENKGDLCFRMRQGLMRDEGKVIESKQLQEYDTSCDMICRSDCQLQLGLEQQQNDIVGLVRDDI